MGQLSDGTGSSRNRTAIQLTQPFEYKEAVDITCTFLFLCKHTGAVSAQSVLHVSDRPSAGNLYGFLSGCLLYQPEVFSKLPAAPHMTRNCFS